MLSHCWSIPYPITLLSNFQLLIHCWATTNPNTLLRYSLFYYIAEHFRISVHTELYPILSHCWGIPYLITLLSTSRILIHCWATPNPNTLLRYSLFYYIAEHFRISIHTQLYPILSHCWGIPYLITLLSNFQILVHCWATPNPNTLLRYSLFYYIAENFRISIYWDRPYPITLLRYTLSYYIAKQFPNTNSLLSYTQS